MTTTESEEVEADESNPLSGVKWWQWILLVLGVVAIAFVIYLIVQIFFAAKQLLERGGEVANTIGDEVSTFWFWSFDDNVPLADRLVAATLIATGISLIVAIAGVVVAAAATSSANRAERKRRKEEIRRQIYEQPYVRTSLVRRGNDGGSITLRLHNTGGAARQCLFIVVVGSDVYQLSDFDLSEGESREFHAFRLADVVYKPPVEREGVFMRLAWGSARDRYGRLIRFALSGDGNLVIEYYTSIAGIINRRERRISVGAPVNQGLEAAGIQGLEFEPGDY